MEETKRRRFIIRAVLEGEVDVSEEPQPVLPEGYTQLQYVEADGRQWINTGVDETQTSHAKYQVLITSQPKVNGNHILSSKNTYFPFLKGINASDPLWRTHLVSDLWGTEVRSPYAWDLNTIYTIEGFPDNKILLDGTQLDTMTPGQTKSASNKIYVFTYGGNINNSDYRFHGYMYYCKIYDLNGDLIRDLIPAKDPDGKAGLYDIINDVFYQSISGTALIAGPEA